MTIENHARPEAPSQVQVEQHVPSACEAEFRRRTTKGNMPSEK